MQYTRGGKANEQSIESRPLQAWKKQVVLWDYMTFTGILAFFPMMIIRQDIRVGISVFGNLTAFKGIEDVIRIGIEYQKGLGILIAILISVFIGQEYQWKTWQHKWIISKSRTHIYLQKPLFHQLHLPLYSYYLS